MHKNLHHLITNEGDIYLTDEEFNELLKNDIDEVDYMHQGQYARESDGTVDPDKELFNKVNEVRGTIDYSSGLRW